MAEYKRLHGGVEGFPGARFEPDGARLLEMDCDVLIPAATERQITTRNAPLIRARKRASLVTKQFRLEQGLGNRRAVDLHERARRPR